MKDLPPNTVFTGTLKVSLWVQDVLSGNMNTSKASKRSKKKSFDSSVKWSEKPSHLVDLSVSEKTLCGLPQFKAENKYFDANHFLGIPVGSDDKPRCKNCMKVYGRGAATGKTTGIL